MVEQAGMGQFDTGQSDTEVVDTEQAETEVIDAEIVDAQQADTEVAEVPPADTHEIEISVVLSEPDRIYAGCDISLQVIVSCASGCDLQGDVVEIMDQSRNAVLKQAELAAFDETANMTDELTLQAPIEPGEYTWTVVYTAQEDAQEDPGTPHEGLPHETGETSFSFVVKPHTITLTSWDVPFPALSGSEFTLKVGARCSAGCKLTGGGIEIYDQQGIQLATGTLSDDPWQSTTALYWTEIALQAPDEEGFYKWEVKYPEPDLELEHEVSDHTFAFRTVRSPEHVVTVELVKKFREETVVKNASVVLHSGGVSYRSRSDDAGIAEVSVPKGEYSITITAKDYDGWQGTVEVADDVAVKAVMTWWPED